MRILKILGLIALAVAGVFLVVVLTILPASRRSGGVEGTLPPLKSVSKTIAANAWYLKMIDSKTGWAMAAAGYVLRTDDGGNTWMDVTPPGLKEAIGAPANTPGEFRPGYFFLDANHAWMVASPFQKDVPATVLGTANGGRSWFLSSAHITGMAYNVTFVNPETGWILAHKGVAAGSEMVALARTQNGGQSWSVLSGGDPESNTVPMGGHKNGLTFLDASKGWLSGFAPYSGKAFLYQSTNGGATWKDTALPAPASFFPDAMFSTMPPVFFGAKDGVLPAIFNQNKQIIIFYATHDGGATWTPGAPVESRLAFSFADMNNGFTLDTSATLLNRTTDGGKTWQQVTPNVSLKGITQLQFISDKVGWATGGGAIVKTTDGGATWTKLAP